ncbi:MAG TPA: 2-hydroxyacid dehydrogenase [Chitinophagaceae bacterium]|nr:2-hydroxyacid dehydrogenase [Chitinophagaceae bacterium]
MKTLFYSIKEFEKPWLNAANTVGLEVSYTDKPLSIHTVEKAAGYDAVCIFAGDDASAPVVEQLAKMGIYFIAVRAAGYDNVDLIKAAELGVGVANVPEYSPYAIAEHAVALILALNRKLILADNGVHQHDFRVDELVGFDLNGKTIGIIGTGRIGGIFTKIMHGFGCRLIGYDIAADSELTVAYGLEYVDLNTLCKQSDIISIHTCLTPETKYIINKKSIALFKKEMTLINTSRGACVNTADLVAGLESGQIGYYGADVYEHEKGLFFYDKSGKRLNDEILDKLLSFPNVLITPHQAFATKDALKNIADTTFYNLGCWNSRKSSKYELTPSFVPLVN